MAKTHRDAGREPKNPRTPNLQNLENPENLKNPTAIRLPQATAIALRL